MKFEYTLAELSTAITALEQVYGKVSVLDPYLGTMLAEGSGQGVLDCKRAEKDYPSASPGARKLCQELGEFQSSAEETWREFV